MSASTGIPPHVRAVRQAMEAARLGGLRRSAQPLPPPHAPILLSVVKDEGDRLADLLRHYREAGIRRFCFIDNGSTDGSLRFLAEQPDVDLLQASAPFEWRAKQGWINRAIADYGLDRWFLYVDADEHVVFDGLGPRGFPELAAEMERRGTLRVRGFLLDMYGPGPLLESAYRPGDRLIDSYPHYDLDGYVESRYREVMSVKGGARRRAFAGTDPSFNPELTKYPLFRLRPGEVMANPHHIWPYDDNFASPRFLAILHFKFLPNVAERIRAAIESKAYWGGSAEYRCYADALRQDPKLALHRAESARYVAPERLVQEALIAPIGWPGEASAAARMLASARRHRAELGAARRFVPGEPGAPPPPALEAATVEALPAPVPALPPVPPAPVARAPLRRPGREGPAAPALDVTVREYRTKAPNYRHADLVVPALPLVGGRTTQVRFKLGIKGVAPRLEFRRGPDWPLFARSWPGTEEDQYGPVFRVGPGGPRQRYMQRIPDIADREALAAIIDRLPDIVAAIIPQLTLGMEDTILLSRAARELPAALA